LHIHYLTSHLLLSTDLFHLHHRQHSLPQSAVLHPSPAFHPSPHLEFELWLVLPRSWSATHLQSATHSRRGRSIYQRTGRTSTNPPRPHCADSIWSRLRLLLNPNSTDGGGTIHGRLLAESLNARRTGRDAVHFVRGSDQSLCGIIADLAGLLVFTRAVITPYNWERLEDTDLAVLTSRRYSLARDLTGYA